MVIKDDRYFMDKALEQAKKAAVNDEVPIGAIIVKNGKIIASAYNSKEKTHNVINHAEMIVLSKACKKAKTWYLNDCIIYTTLEPCTMCGSAILQARIKKIIFGAVSDSSGCFGGNYNLLEVSGIGRNVEIISGVMKEECSNVLSEFFRRKR